jgi:hypothetical protein
MLSGPSFMGATITAVAIALLVSSSEASAQPPGQPSQPTVEVRADHSLVITYVPSPTPPATSASLAATFNNVPVPGSPFAIGLLTTITTGPVAAGTYTVQVIATNDFGQTASATTTFVVGSSEVPGVPSLLPVEVSGQTVTLRWVAGSGTATGFDLEATRQGTEVVTFSVPNQSSVTVPNVPAGAYSIRVRARNGQRTSAYSDPIIATVGSLLEERRLYVHRMDPRLYGIVMADGTSVDVSAEKDGDGTPFSLSRTQVRNLNGTTKTMEFASDGRPNRLVTSQGSSVSFEWRNATAAMVRVYAPTGTLANSGQIDLGPTSDLSQIFSGEPSHARTSDIQAHDTVPTRFVSVNVVDQCGKAVTNADVSLVSGDLLGPANVKIPWGGVGATYFTTVPVGPDPAAPANAEKACKAIYGTYIHQDVDALLYLCHAGGRALGDGKRLADLLVPLVYQFGPVIAAEVTQTILAACTAAKQAQDVCSKSAKFVDWGQQLLFSTTRVGTTAIVQSRSWAEAGAPKRLVDPDALHWNFFNVPCQTGVQGTWTGTWRQISFPRPPSTVTYTFTEDSDGNVTAWNNGVLLLRGRRYDDTLWLDRVDGRNCERWQLTVQGDTISGRGWYSCGQLGQLGIAIADLNLSRVTP